MLFKRLIEGKSVLKAPRRPDPTEEKQKCQRRRSECVVEFCAEHSTLIEETLKMALLGCVLWAGLTLGSFVAPYPLNLIVSADIMHPPPLYDFPFPSAQNLRRLPPITAKHVNRSVSFGAMTVDKLARLEDNLQASDITARKGTLARGLLLHGYLNDEARKYDKSSMILMRASENLVATSCTRYGLKSDECASFISTLNLRNTEFGPECASLERFSCSSAKMNSRYRSFDGSCNNPGRSSWGQALTGYKRLLHPKYSDGIDEPRRASSGRHLPSAHIISSNLTTDLDRPDPSKTIALAVWSQFVHHDLAHTPVKKMVHSGASIRCCDASGAPLAPRHRHPSCLPIPTSHPYESCMEYVRSATTYRGDCSFGASEQMNQASHFLDASHVYGASARAAAELRAPSGGLLRTDGDLLPASASPEEHCLLGDAETACFMSGDLRANLHPWLSALHTVWAREHNRIARELATLNPAWGGDRLYHEARRVVVAEIQHITYRHWLPKLTGKSPEDLYVYDTDYDADTDPTVANAVATAAFHFVHSMLAGDVQLLDTDGAVAKSVELMRHFFRPVVLTEDGGVERVVRGMISQRSQGVDLNYVNDLRAGWLGGLDALAVDVQRGRDHGLPPYHQYRTLCGLPPANTFQHFADVMDREVIDKLSAVYKDAHDVDLVVGAMAERPQEGSLLGPTFTCLIKEQLQRTRAGDRYFYSHAETPGAFGKRQLAELRRASLAGVLCDNVPGLRRARRDVFSIESDANPLVSCEDIKRVNLDEWQDGRPSDILTRTQSNVKKWIKRVNG